MNQSHIPGFPNKIPNVDWQNGLPTFQGRNGDCARLHEISFRLHIVFLKINFPEYCLMKMFMLTLKEDAKVWYEGLPPTSICSLEDFYSALYERY